MLNSISWTLAAARATVARAICSTPAAKAVRSS
jgi:hypothetical protein